MATKTISCALPVALYERLKQRAYQKTKKGSKAVNLSDVIRAAIEDYLNKKGG